MARKFEIHKDKVGLGARWGLKRDVTLFARKGSVEGSHATPSLRLQVETHPQTEDASCTAEKQEVSCPGIATGTIDDFNVTRQTDTDKTAENYFLQSRYDRDLSETAYLFGGAGWDRNTFAGIQNRYAIVVGAGLAWFDEEARRFKTDLGLTYTIQDDVVPNPSVEDSFGGIRATLDFFQTLSASTDFASLLVVDENLNESDDLRGDWTNSITVAMSDNLALKASLRGPL